MGYYHIATEVWYGEDSDPSSYTVCDGSGEDPDCINSVDGDCIEDHLVYLGWSTDCNDNYEGAVSCSLFNLVNKDNDDFYDKFERIVANCGTQGFI